MKRVLTEDGKDITEAVQVLYDIAHSSMDWGSGFLDREEMESVIGLAVELGFPVLPSVPYNSNETHEWLLDRFPDHYELFEREIRPAKGEPYISRYIRQKEKNDG